MMETCKLALLLAVCATVAFGFTCPEDSHTSYHADVSTGCQVYFLCENSQLRTLSCPSGKAFNYVTSKCEDATTVDCRETTRDHAALQYFREKVYPEYLKWMQYLLRMAASMVEKAYKSYELSNSTHIAFVSMSDIFEEVWNDVKPILRLRRHLSHPIVTQLSQFIPQPENKNIHVRNKRESPPIPDFLLSLIRPVVNNMIQSITGTIFGNLESFTARVVMPTIYDIFGDKESRYNMLGLWLSAKSAYSPFLWEMMKRQTYDTPEGTIIYVPRHMFEEATEKFRTESKPFLYKIAEMHLPTFLKRASENVPALLDGIRQFDKVQYKHSGVLKDAIMHFFVKHGAVIQNSTSSHISTYTLTEIMNDLRPIKMNLLKMLIEFYKQDPDSFLNVLLGPDSILTQSMLPPPVYAEPAEPQKPQKPQKVKDSKVWENY